MRNKLLILHFLLAFCITAIIVAVFLTLHTWVISFLAGAALLFAALIFRTWMLYVEEVLFKSDKALNINPENQNKNWLGNLDRLIKNQHLIEHKFQLSAKLISNLSQVDSSESVDELLKEDPIGKALQNIRNEMRQLKEEDEKQAWITNGLAKFSSILRDKVEVKQYAQNIISYLVKYLNANQGGLYIESSSEEDGRCLELVACYAYGKRKFVEKKIQEGQGILGQCMLEKDFIFLTDIPDSYVKITSGLGEATPRNIIVAPLVFNDIFCGAIELAFFQVLKPHEVEFVKKICQDIASEVASLKNVQHTQQLLQDSGKLTVELQAREEEMRQSMEELAATQEEMSRKQTELSGIMNAIDSTLAMVELNTEGKIIKNNFSFEEFLGFNSNQLLQKDFRLLIGNESEVSWNNILDEVIKSGDFKTTSKQGLVIWLSITFTPVKDQSQLTQKILCMIQNITQRKNKEKEFERLSLVTDNTDNSVIITDRNGLIEYVNEGFTKITGYEANEVVGKKPGDILQGPLTDKNIVKKLGEQIKAGVPIYEEILNYNKKKETYWVSLAINPVRNVNGEIDKFISIQSNITDTKIKALDFHQKLTALGKSNAIIEIDRMGNILEANDNYLELLGYELKDLIGKPYSILTNKENTFQKVLTTISEYGVQSGVFSRFDKNGRTHFMKLKDYPVMNIQGDLEKIIEFGVDVSNEKRLEKEAARKQAELNGYLNGVNNTIASVEFTLDGKLVTANEIFIKVLGYSGKELLSMDYLSLMSEEHSAIMMWENLKVGKFFSGEFKMKNKEGKEFWLSGTFNPIIIEAQTPEKILMLAQFTTQEKEKLNDLNALVHAFKSTLPVMEFTNTFSCKSANDMAMKLFGVSRIELKSKGIANFIAPYYLPKWEKIKASLSSDDVTFINLPLLRDTKVVTYEVSISIIRNLDGTVSKYVILLVKEIQDQVALLAVG